MAKVVLGLQSETHEPPPLEALVVALSGRSLLVSVLMETEPEFDLDRPGKDSYRHRQAGANEVMVSSTHRWTLLHERREGGQALSLSDIADRSSADILLVVGFKDWPIDRICLLDSGQAAGKSVALLAHDKNESSAEVSDLGALVDFLVERYSLSNDV
ncbi:MAG: molybdopterin-guanine dinucleotide biosynthesis protein MobB [Pseudomonadota bacterium]